MSESVEIQIARLQQDVSSLGLRVNENHDAAKGEWTEIKSQLGQLIRLTNEWSGIRKALIGLSAILTLIGSLAGAVFAYVWHRV